MKPPLDPETGIARVHLCALCGNPIHGIEILGTPSEAASMAVTRASEARETVLAMAHTHCVRKTDTGGRSLSFVSTSRLVQMGFRFDDRSRGRKHPGRQSRIPVPLTVRYAILARDGFRCCACGIAVHDHSDVRLDVDHKIPVSHGGTNEPSNLETLCYDCNQGKRATVFSLESLPMPIDISLEAL